MVLVRLGSLDTVEDAAASVVVIALFDAGVTADWVEVLSTLSTLVDAERLLDA